MALLDAARGMHPTLHLQRPSDRADRPFHIGIVVLPIAHRYAQAAFLSPRRPGKNASPDSTTLAITLSVRLPRIGLRCARQQIPMLGAGRRPQPESTIYMHPRPRFMRDRNQLGERIIGPNIDITSLQDDDGRAMAVLLQRPQEFRCFQLSLFRNRRFGAATIRAALGFP